MQRVPFTAVCSELSRLSTQLMNREGDPQLIVNEAGEVLVANQDHLVAEAKSNLDDVPTFARACATLLRSPVGPTTELQLATIFDAYVTNGRGDVNDHAAVLAAAHSMWNRSTNQSASVFPSITRGAFRRSVELWASAKKQTRTDSLISLLHASGVETGAFGCEVAMGDVRTLLPVKSKLKMEAKIQRSHHAREILQSMREVNLSRIDAGLCLNVMASTGLYDQQVVDTCCAVLHASNSLVSSQQFTQILYNLGVLQHRHIHQQFFANRIQLAKCTSDAVRRLAQAQAMLQMPVTNSKALMDGVFLHALRPVQSTSNVGLHHSWYSDVGFALFMLGIRHHKFMLHASRTIRCDLHRMDQRQLLRVMFALGGERLENVSPDLRGAWPKKVEKVLSIASQKLEAGVPFELGGLTIQALAHCGIKEHPMIPKLPAPSSSDMNPVDMLLKIWKGAPPTQVIDLAGKIEQHHFKSAEPSVQLTEVFEILAQQQHEGEEQSIPEHLHYKLSTLCECVELHVLDMSLESVVRTLRSLVRIGAGDRYESARRVLLNKLWENRAALSPSNQVECCRVLEKISSVPLAMELLEFVSQDGATAYE